MPDQSPRIRAVDCYKPRGPFSKTDFYRQVREGDIELDHIGRKALTHFSSVAELQADLIEKNRQRRAALAAAE